MSTSPTGSSKDNSTDFFRQLSQQKEVSPPPIPHQSRVKAGLIMGALLGLVYGLISQLLNALLLAGVPLALYPFGLVGNLIASIVVWSIVGGVCAAPDNGPLGIILGSLTMAGAVTLWTWLVVPPAGDIFNRAFMNAGYVAIFIVAVLLGVPLMLLVRWAVDLQGELALKPWWSWRRLRAPIAAIALLGVVTSILTLYSEDMRESMIMLNTLIKRVGAAARVEDVPVALEGNGVSIFLRTRLVTTRLSGASPWIWAVSSSQVPISPIASALCLTLIPAHYPSPKSIPTGKLSPTQLLWHASRMAGCWHV